ncbi:2-hydroxymuconate tautomerase [Methanoculleus sp. 7T]|jgi:4-oxalocrotonate tautomerase|uniref:2-hydroxymuconate tautomerase n=1 Tax=Methanoculleus sp. 7T TaxID=2937282 RepID=UPI0020C0CF40|nr:2-hydroxymuconate tautomerase [Methanoculleus sp. 7T]MCK8518819.1 4-oxalocrotonate tautomerase family protein [Methanoculleus sp. 7T]
MPVVTIRMAEGRTLEQKRKLAGEITAAIVGTLGVDPERVMVFFEELESENIARAGRLLSES